MNLFPALKRVQGICVGDTFKTQHATCGDLDSKDPSCNECQQICHSDAECTGFFVKLDKNSQGKIATWKCFFKKGQINVNIPEKGAFYCFQKRKGSKKSQE